MTTACQKCGDRGFKEHLVFCNKCQVSAEHRYCLDEGSKLKVNEVHWLCTQCVMGVHKVETMHPMNTRRKRKCVMRHRLGRSRHTDLHRHLKESFIAKTSMNADVHNDAKLSKGSKSPNIQGDLLSPSKRNGVLPERENSECLGNEVEGNLGNEVEGRLDNEVEGRLDNEVEGRKMKRKRRLILDDDSDEDAPSSMPIDNVTDGFPYRSTTHLNKLQSPSQQNCSIGTAQPNKSLTESAAECYSYFPVTPIIDSVWRGYFNICDRKYGPVVAHLSNIACEKVCNVAGMLPHVLHFEKLPRLEAWPKSFESCTPTDDNIGLYFFPGDVRAKVVLEQLVDDVIKKDLALKVTVHKTELLVFSSMLLPQQCHLLEGKRYLWGVFRGRQDPKFTVPLETRCPQLSEAAGPADEHERYKVSEDASTQCLNDQVEGNDDDDDNGFKKPRFLGGQVPDVFGGSKAPGRRAPGPYPSGLNQVTEEPAGDCEDSLSRREASRPHLPLDSCGFVDVANRPVVKTLDSDVEFDFTGDVDGSLTACLELFPLGVEDLGIAARLPDCVEVDLELGLETVKGKKYECRPAHEEPVVSLFGKTIC